MKTTIWTDKFDASTLKEDWLDIFTEVNGIDKVNELIENDTLEYALNEYAVEAEYSYRNDLMHDLDIKGDYIMIADIGLWNGRKVGYKTFNNLKEVLYTDSDYMTVYTDAYNLLRTTSHHDGTNYAMVREFKDTLSYEQRENFMIKLLDGKATKNDVSRYTTSVKQEVLKAIGVI